MTRTYEVGDGTRTYGVFPTESKAKAHLKELKAEGTKARIYVSYDGPEAPKKETKPKKITKAQKKAIDRLGKNGIQERSDMGIVLACEALGADSSEYIAMVHYADGSASVDVSCRNIQQVWFDIDETGDGRYRIGFHGFKHADVLSDPGVLEDGISGAAFDCVEFLVKNRTKNEPKKSKKAAKPRTSPKSDTTAWLLTEDALRTGCTSDSINYRSDYITISPVFTKAGLKALEEDHTATVKVRAADGKHAQFSVVEKADGFDVVYTFGTSISSARYAKNEMDRMLEESVRASISFILNNSKAKCRTNPKGGKRTSSTPETAPKTVTSQSLSKQLAWDRVRTNGGLVEDAYIVGEKGVYRLVVDMVEMDDVYDWNASVHLGGHQVGSLSMRLGRKSEGSAKYRQLIEERTVALFLGQDRFVEETTAGEYERWTISHRKDGDPGDGQPKKKVTKSKPRNAAAGKGQYSASYYEKLERELKRAEKEGDNDAIIAITREIAESLSAEGEEIPDARAYLDDSDYGELARNSRWKYDSKETNRRYLKKIRDEQAMYGNANRKKMGGRRR